MKTLLRWGLLLPIIFGLFVVPACKKYDNGPLLSLRSKEERVINNWRAKSILRNEIDETERYSVYDMNFTAGRLAWDVRQVQDTQAVSVGAGWALYRNNRFIRLTFDTPDPVSGEVRLLDLEIKELREDEMRLRYQLDGDRYQVHLLPR